MSDGSPSQVPVFVLAGFAVGALALLGISVWLGVRLGRTRQRGPRLLQAVLVGVALAFLTLVVAGQRHYGGSTKGADGPTGSARNCDVWYQEAGLPADRKGFAGDLSASCRHDAVAAIGPALGVAAAVGVVGTGLVFGTQWLWLRRRRRERSPGTRYVDA